MGLSATALRLKVNSHVTMKETECVTMSIETHRPTARAVSPVEIQEQTVRDVFLGEI